MNKEVHLFSWIEWDHLLMRDLRKNFLDEGLDDSKKLIKIYFAVSRWNYWLGFSFLKELNNFCLNLSAEKISPISLKFKGALASNSREIHFIPIFLNFNLFA